MLLIIGLFADAVFNGLNFHALSDSTTWSFQPTIPTLGEPGADLRILMHGADQIAHGINPYAQAVAYPPPPFAAVFFYPFTLLGHRTAYLVQYSLLIAFNLVGIGLISACLFRSGPRPDEGKSLVFPVMATGALVTLFALVSQFHGYGLELALERGNFDSYVLVLASAAIASMVRWPDRVLLPVVLLSAASHLKIYPAILLLLPLLQAGKRALAPLALVNLAMLLVFGPGQVRPFLEQIVGYMDKPYVWFGNHSIAAYVIQVVGPAFAAPSHQPELIQAWTSRLIAVLVVGLWAHGTFRIRHLTPLARRWLLMAALSFPVMSALSSTSHDYKLVIHVLPVLVNLYLFGETFLAVGSLTSLAGLVLTLGCSLLISRSTIIGPWLLQGTKFPAIFLLLLVTYWQTYVVREPALAREGARRSSQREALLVAVMSVVMAVPAIAHVALCIRGRYFERLSEARLRSISLQPAPVLQAPDATGYGAIKLQLQLPGTAEGIPEPIFVCGQPGQASLVYVRLLPNSQIKIGVEFWGMGAFESDAFNVISPYAVITVNCSLPCLYPPAGNSAWKDVPTATQQKLRQSYTITVNDVPRLLGSLNQVQPDQSPRYYGRNPIGGSLVSAAFTGTIISAVQVQP